MSLYDSLLPPPPQKVGCVTETSEYLKLLTVYEYYIATSRLHVDDCFQIVATVARLVSLGTWQQLCETSRIIFVYFLTYERSLKIASIQ